MITLTKNVEQDILTNVDKNNTGMKQTSGASDTQQELELTEIQTDADIDLPSQDSKYNQLLLEIKEAVSRLRVTLNNHITITANYFSQIKDEIKSEN